VAGPSSCAADQGRRVRTGESCPDEVRIGRSANVDSAGRRYAHPGRGAVRIAPGETRGMGRGRSRPSRRDGVNGGDLRLEGRQSERRGDA